MDDIEELKGLTYTRSGIFGYLNYLVERDRKYILDTLVNGTARSLASIVRALSAGSQTDERSCRTFPARVSWL